VKRISAVAALGSLAVLVPVVASAAPAKDSVNGHGDLQSPSINKFAFAMHAGPNGENPKGTAHVHDNSTKDGNQTRRFQGKITCLRVDGNRATFVLDFTHVKDRARDGVIVTVVDNGNPAGQESADRIRISDYDGAAPACPDPNAIEPGGRIEGDISVTDG
jgi:hypothetical protein